MSISEPTVDAGGTGLAKATYELYPSPVRYQGLLVFRGLVRSHARVSSSADLQTYMYAERGECA